MSDRNLILFSQKNFILIFENQRNCNPMMNNVNEIFSIIKKYLFEWDEISIIKFMNIFLDNNLKAFFSIISKDERLMRRHKSLEWVSIYY